MSKKRRIRIGFEGETMFAYDPSYVDFTIAFRDLLNLTFGAKNVDIVDNGHGGGVEFYGDYMVKTDWPISAIQGWISAISTMIDGGNFENLIIHEGDCKHPEFA